MVNTNSFSKGSSHGSHGSHGSPPPYPREVILSILKKNRNPVSGTLISRETGITRVAVWKHIKKLKEEGYSIKSSSEGYSLSGSDSPLSLLRWEYPGRKGKIFIFREIDSTMNKARELARGDALHMTAVAAERQTEGRGSKNSQWDSERGSLYFTLILRPRVKLHRYHLYTLAAAAAAADFIQKFGVKAVCRWPNEVHAGGGKIAGILTEVSGFPEQIDYILLGVGVNINNSQGGNKSLSMITKKEIPLNSALKTILMCIEEHMDLSPDIIPSVWEKKSGISGSKSITASGVRSGKKISGSILHLDNDGNLVITTAGEDRVTLYPGE